MATTYKPVTLPPAGIARGITLAALVAEGATLYSTDNGEVEARDGWGDLGDGTPVPSPRPPSWVVLAAPTS